MTYSPTDICSNGVPVLRSNNIKNQKIVLTDLVRVNSKILEKQYLKEGDLLICARNGSRHLVGKCALISKILEPISFGAFMAVCRSKYNHWIYYLLHTEYFDRYLDDSNSTAINQVTQKMLLAFQVPLPPFAEQKRIVAEIEKWFALIDELEANKQDLQQAIKQVKNKILDLAIHGKLVPQDPNDEPAIDLLRRINPNFTPCDTSHYQNLPRNWSICRLEDIVDYEQPTQYIVETTNYSDEYGIPVLTAGKSFILGYTNETNVIYNNLPTIIFDDFTTDSRLVDFPFKVKSSAMKILQVHKEININYVAYFMSITRLIGDTHKRYWISEYSKIPIPIPPKQEQDRIVAAIQDFDNVIQTINAEL